MQFKVLNFKPTSYKKKKIKKNVSLESDVEMT